MKRRLIFVLALSTITCQKTEKKTSAIIQTTKPNVSLNLDSIEKANAKEIEITGDSLNKLIISRKDSTIWITANMRYTHRIFGYQKPDVNSKKLILISIFTSDVENNVFGFPLGAYYQTDADHYMKYLKPEKEFILADYIEREKPKSKIYILKKNVEFED